MPIRRREQSLLPTAQLARTRHFAVPGSTTSKRVPGESRQCCAFSSQRQLSDNRWIFLAHAFAQATCGITDYFCAIAVPWANGRQLTNNQCFLTTCRRAQRGEEEKLSTKTTAGYVKCPSAAAIRRAPPPSRALEGRPGTGIP